MGAKAPSRVGLRVRRGRGDGRARLCSSSKDNALASRRRCADDFRVVLFLRGPLEDSEAAGFRGEAPRPARGRRRPLRLARGGPRRPCAARTPELVDSVALVGENPLPGAFEVRPRRKRCRDWPRDRLGRGPRGLVRRALEAGSAAGPYCAPRLYRPLAAPDAQHSAVRRGGAGFVGPVRLLA